MLPASVGMRRAVDTITVLAVGFEKECDICVLAVAVGVALPMVTTINATSLVMVKYAESPPRKNIKGFGSNKCENNSLRSTYVIRIPSSEEGAAPA